MRADKSRGVSIGLSITKRLVKALGGTIDSISDTENGTVFWIELPAA